MKKIILLITMAAVVASCNIYNEGRLMVPEAIVQNKVSKSFPITKNYILAKGIIEKPQVSFKEDKMHLNVNYTLSSLGEEQKGSMKISSGIKFDDSTKEVYMVGLNIDEITNEQGAKLDDTKVAIALKQIISNYIETQPVYKYENEDGKKLNIKNIIIENGKLYVQTK
jgi:hypothetical protein